MEYKKIIELAKQSQFGELYENADLTDLANFANAAIELNNKTMTPTVWMAENIGFHPTFVLDRPDYAIDAWIPLYDLRGDDLGI